MIEKLPNVTVFVGIGLTLFSALRPVREWLWWNQRYGTNKRWLADDLIA